MKRALFAVLAMLFASPAAANVSQSSDSGFVVRQVAEVPVTPQEAWALLVQPSQWWNPAHTFSADASNLSLDERAGGCWCEILRNPDSPNAAPLGSVEHLRVIYIERDRALRLSGGLGPLQSEAVVGTMTFQLKGGEGGTRILLEYVVGGYMRAPTSQISPAVDAVLGEQLSRFADRLGGRLVPLAATEPAMEPAEDEGNLAPSVPDLGPETPDEEPAPGILPIDPDAAADDGFEPAPIVGR
jgi:hypothetical protein